MVGNRFLCHNGVYMSQLVRICDINLEINSLVADIKDMTAKFIHQGFITVYQRNVKKYLPKI